MVVGGFNGGWVLVNCVGKVLIRNWEALIAIEGCQWYLGSINLVAEGNDQVAKVVDPLRLHQSCG